MRNIDYRDTWRVLFGSLDTLLYLCIAKFSLLINPHLWWNRWYSNFNPHLWWNRNLRTKSILTHGAHFEVHGLMSGLGDGVVFVVVEDIDDTKGPVIVCWSASFHLRRLVSVWRWRNKIKHCKRDEMMEVKLV